MEEKMITENLLKVDEGLRPRANSDPTVGGKIKTPFQMPEIMIEDCADNDELSQIESQRDQGGLFGSQATPRRRAHTCPEDLFRRKNARPPTPPPSALRKDPRKKTTILKAQMKETISFAHHRLGKLTEDSSEGVSSSSSSCGSDRSRSKSIAVIPFRPSASGLLGASLAVGSFSAPASSREDLPGSPPSVVAGSDSTRERLPNLGECPDDAECPTTKAEDSASDSEGSASELAHKSSKDCRFSESKPPGIDGAHLQAC